MGDGIHKCIYLGGILYDGRKLGENFLKVWH